MVKGPQRRDVDWMESELYDPETGLATRKLFRDRTEHALSRTVRTNGRVGLLLLEVEAGDTEVPDGRNRRATAEAVVRCVRPQDTVSWLEDGYVGVLVEDIDGSSGVQKIRSRIEGAVPACVASSVAVSDAHGRIGFWMGAQRSA